MNHDDAGEGPMEHAGRSASQRSYLDKLSEGVQMAFIRASGGRPDLASKRALVSISHAIEQAVMSAAIDSPTVVVALFQRLRFVDPYSSHRGTCHHRMGRQPDLTRSDTSSLWHPTEYSNPELAPRRVDGMLRELRLEIVLRRSPISKKTSVRSSLP